MNLHFIGIGGCGMNGVAQLAAHAGYRVSGSDRAFDQEIFHSTGGREAARMHGNDHREWQTLEKQGITIIPQDGSGITKETDFVVYSTAIESDNPDIQRAKALGIPLLHRAEMLAKLCESKQVIAVAGTAGKSTVTGLLGYIFQCLEKDPTVYCGATINNFGTSVRFGSENGPWIIEADESDKSFLHFHPNHAIITNIAEDHFELSELRKLFSQFESQVSGTVILGSRDGYNTIPQAPSPALIGKHNTENINNALTLCKALGLNLQKCIEAVSSFKGIERRLERIGNNVIDDFAHSPIKIEAALEAVSDVWPVFNVVWRPHGFSPLFQGLDGFVEVFKRRGDALVASKKRDEGVASTIFILPVYYAGGTVDKKITSAQFVEKLQAASVRAELAPDFQTLEKRLLEENRPVLIMGARDPELPKFARRIAAKLDQNEQQLNRGCFGRPEAL